MTVSTCRKGNCCDVDSSRCRWMPTLGQWTDSSSSHRCAAASFNSSWTWASRQVLPLHVFV